jgi:hypothetical protein
LSPPPDHSTTSGVVTQSSTKELPSAVSTVPLSVLSDAVKNHHPPPPPVVETVDDDSVSDEPPALHSRKPSSDDDNDSLIDLFASDNYFASNNYFEPKMHSVEIHLSGLPFTDDVLLDDSLVDDPDLDVDESEFDQLPHCRCFSPKSPIDQFLLTTAVAPFQPVPDAPVLHHDFDDAGNLREHTINEVCHCNFDGLRAHFDDGAQASTTHKKSHLFAYNAFYCRRSLSHLSRLRRWSSLRTHWLRHSSSPCP